MQVGCKETDNYSAVVNHPKVSAKLVGLPRLGGVVVLPLNQHDPMQKRSLLGLSQDALFYKRSNLLFNLLSIFQRILCRSISNGWLRP